MEGVWGCLGTGLDVILSCSPGHLWCSAAAHSSSAGGERELLLPLRKATSFGGAAIGCAFLLPYSGVCLRLTKSKRVH